MLVLEGGAVRAELAPERGGMVTRLAIDGAPVLFLDEATFADPTKNVRGGVPVLFPIAGKLDPDRLPGATAPMKQHGFARNLPWRVVAAAPDRAVLGLDADDATRALYPHDFALRYTYVAAGGALRIEQRFENRGAAAMPIQPGLHPYFLVPDKAGARVETDATVAWDNVARARVPVGATIDLGAAEVDLHLLDHHPRGTRLVRPGARPVVLGWSDDQRVLVVWTLAGRDFVCVEPWSAPANALVTGGETVVAPGGAHESWLEISLG
jgi:galactose mutarotase-like enzyme